jgi:tetratricopeptide (TPR) repeat protein
MGRLVAALLLSGLAGQAAWLHLRSGSFDLYTSASAGNGREVLQRLEQIRHVFETRTQQKNLTPLPVRVYVFRSEPEFRRFQVKDNAAGYYQSAPDRDYIAMQLTGTDLYRVVYHEYVHLLMRHSGVHVPVWLNEGTAEVYSTTAIKGSRVRIGDLIPSHVSTLRSEPLIDLSILLMVTHDSPHYNERDKTGIFYAQSWALAHMLNFSAEYRAGMPNFLSILLSGDDPVRAFQQAFGKSLRSVREDLAAYIRQDRFAGVRFEAEKLPERGRVPAESVEELDAELLLADLLIAIGRGEQAEAALQKLASAHPDRADLQEALGDAAVRRDEDERARRHYERALELGSRSGRLRYDYAMLLRELNAPAEQVMQSLRDAVLLEPKLFEARYLLGYMLLDQGKPVEAIEQLRAAVELRPFRCAAWEHLALAHLQAGQKKEALASAQRARKLAVTPEDISRTEATLSLIQSDTDSIVRAPVTTAEPRIHWARPDAEAQIDGLLIQVDCLRDKARLHVIHDGRRTFLKAGQGAGGPPAELACGPVQSRPVRITYKRIADRAWGTSGEVVTLQFR